MNTFVETHLQTRFRFETSRGIYKRLINKNLSLQFILKYDAAVKFHYVFLICAFHFQHFPDGATDPVSACPLSTPTVSRKRPKDRSVFNLTAQNNKKRKINFELLATDHNLDHLLPCLSDVGDDNENVVVMDTESTVEASNGIQSSCINKCVNTDPVNNFMEEVLRADDSCFYYTGIPNVNL